MGSEMCIRDRMNILINIIVLHINTVNLEPIATTRVMSPKRMSYSKLVWQILTLSSSILSSSSLTFCTVPVDNDGVYTNILDVSQNATTTSSEVVFMQDSFTHVIVVLIVLSFIHGCKQFWRHEVLPLEFQRTDHARTDESRDDSKQAISQQLCEFDLTEPSGF